MDKIEFIIPTYERTNHLITLVGSLLAQTNSSWTAHIISDNPPLEVIERINDFIKFVGDYRIKFTNLPQRHNDWGHTPRNYGLKNAQEKWVIMTGEDNYYAPTFVEDFLNAGNASNRVHLVYCNMVLDYMNKEYIPVKTKLEFGHIDIGNVMYQRKYTKDLELDTKFAGSDYTFLVEYLKKIKHIHNPILKVDKILYVHN